MNEPAENTDTEIWRERPGDYYADSIFVTAEGNIGLNCGGLCIIKPIREWHALATQEEDAARAEFERQEFKEAQRVLEEQEIEREMAEEYYSRHPDD
jgi:hypothetical protein